MAALLQDAESERMAAFDSVIEKLPPPVPKSLEAQRAVATGQLTLSSMFTTSAAATSAASLAASSAESSDQSTFNECTVRWCHMNKTELRAEFLRVKGLGIGLSGALDRNIPTLTLPLIRG